MDFSFTEEQTLLRNSVSAYLSDRYTFEAWRKFTRQGSGRDEAHWKDFAELGLLAAPLPEAYGGLGGGPVETMIIAEEFGKALVIEPYISTAIVAGGLIARLGSEAQKQEWLGKIAAGQTIIAFAFAEPQSRFDLFDVATSAKKADNGFILNGRKSVVLGAPWADTLLVTARTAGTRREEKGIGLFLIDKSAAAARDFPTVDGGRAAEIVFENTPAQALGDPGGAYPDLERAVDEAIAAHAAEALGAMRVLVDATVAYAKTRKQFGTPIGKFQVLQHRMVDMFVALEQSLSSVLLATLKAETPEHAKWASAAKVQTGRAGRLIGQQAIQIHGGMGMTDELNVGHYFKRLTMLDTLYGNVDYHVKRFASL